jgi:hypothetical protein
MTVYTVEANTGSSVWPVAELEIDDEVTAYLRSQTAYALQVSPGNAGMYVAPRAADALVNLLDAKVANTVPEDKTVIHDEAIRDMAKLVQLAATHHGAQISWQQPGS